MDEGQFLIYRYTSNVQLGIGSLPIFACVRHNLKTVDLIQKCFCRIRASDQTPFFLAIRAPAKASVGLGLDHRAVSLQREPIAVHHTNSRGPWNPISAVAVNVSDDQTP